MRRDQDRRGHEIAVVGTARTIAEALEQTEALRPDIVLVDVSLGDESGFDLVESFPDLRSGVVLISTRAEEDLTDLIATSPAVGSLSKSRLSPSAVRELVPVA
jgi:two-component system, NarL family, nitrate/nitrite response regulator NarL